MGPTLKPLLASNQLPAATECSGLCKSSNEQAPSMLSALRARSDVNSSALAELPTCKFYRWTEKALDCGSAGLKVVSGAGRGGWVAWWRSLLLPAG